VDQLLLVQPAECGCGTDGEAQEPRHFHRPWKEAIESLTARIFEHERHLPTVLGEDQGPNRPIAEEAAATSSLPSSGSLAPSERSLTLPEIVPPATCAREALPVTSTIAVTHATAKELEPKAAQDGSISTVLLKRLRLD